uniref:Uncharacterized protein n=1 Tax=Glossina morsitans morsitans TaxID=37546 RepID=A0A1B0F9H6_GLOMM
MYVCSFEHISEPKSRMFQNSFDMESVCATVLFYIYIYFNKSKFPIIHIVFAIRCMPNMQIHTTFQTIHTIYNIVQHAPHTIENRKGYIISAHTQKVVYSLNTCTNPVTKRAPRSLILYAYVYIFTSIYHLSSLHSSPCHLPFIRHSTHPFIVHPVLLYTIQYILVI